MRAPCSWYVVVLLAGGCDQLFNIDSFHHIDAHQGSSGDGSGDMDDGGPPIDAAPYCTGAFIDDTFTMPTPCSKWGMQYTSGPSAVVAQGGGMLHLRPGAQALSVAACNGNSVMYGNGGLVVDVGDVLGGNQGESTYLAIYASSEGPSIGVRSGMLRFGPVNGLQPYSAPIQYDATMMHWWRLAPSTDRMSLVASYSADGISWTIFGMHPMVLPESIVTMSLSAQLSSSGTFTNEGMFRRFVSCP